MPESNEKIVVEGTNVTAAVKEAAESLGVDVSLIQYKLDVSHFRNAAGRSQAVDTVKLIAWARDSEELVGALAAKEWLTGLFERMNVEVEIGFTVTGDKVVNMQLTSDRARHLVGRQGSTIRSLRGLLGLAMDEEHTEWTFNIDVSGGPDDRDERRDRDHRGDRGDRGDRGGRRDSRDRGGRRDARDRGGRRDSRGRDDDSRRDSRGGDDDSRREQNLKKLRELAVRLANEAMDSGEPVVMRRTLNSYERRVVHLAVEDMEGVVSESQGDGSHKQIVFVASEA